MAIDLLTAGLGLVILLLAGDALVRGAVNLALRMGIPALIVSLTIVAFGTSAPELLISINAVRDNAGGLALGNVVGSNIANVLLVLGVPAVMTGLATRDHDTKRSFLFMIAASLLFIVACFLGPLRWYHGLILLVALGGVLWDATQSARNHRREQATQNYGADELEDLEGADPTMPWWKIALFTVLGLIGLPLGADLLVTASVNIATDLGVSDTVIGLTLVAIGTSLPELATTVMAALRNQADVALGNVIGSNMFNLLAIMGIASMVGPIPVDPEIMRFDLWVMLAASLALVPFVFMGRNMGRKIGIGFSALYVLYLVMVVV